MPKFEFQEKAHNSLISRIADTNKQREALQQDYVSRYNNILKQKKHEMVNSLKDRF